jgi:hypothetical protein
LLQVDRKRYLLAAVFQDVEVLETDPAHFGKVLTLPCVPDSERNEDTVGLGRIRIFKGRELFRGGPASGAARQKRKQQSGL